MQKGKVVEQGSAKTLFANPQHDYTKMLLAAEPKGNPPPIDPAAENLVCHRKSQSVVPDQAWFFSQHHWSYQSR